MGVIKKFEFHRAMPILYTLINCAPVQGRSQMPGILGLRNLKSVAKLEVDLRNNCRRFKKINIDKDYKWI